MRNKLSLLSLFVWITTVPVFGQDSIRGWWGRENEGWFFYNEEIAPEVVEVEVEDRAQPPGELYTERMERLGRELMSRAVENPTEENVRAYMEYNKAMLEVSDNFSRMWQKVIMKYPELLFETNLKYAQEDIEKAINSLSEKAGLYFIHSSTCPACQKQAKALIEFQNKYPMVVFPITLDNPLPEYPDAERDNGIVSRLGVTNVPALFIAFPEGGRIDLIAAGFVDRFELERRLFNYAQPIQNKSVENIDSFSARYFSDSTR